MSESYNSAQKNSRYINRSEPSQFQPKYLRANSQFQSSVGDNPSSEIFEKQKIIEQNIKLKAQIYELANELQEILEKDKNRKRNLGPISNQDDDQTLKQKKMQLKKQQLQILEMKNKIYVVKRQLEGVYNNRNMINKEEQLRSLKAQLRQLEEEKEGLLRIKKQQSKNLRILKNQQEFHQKIDFLKKELTKVKEQSRAINQKVMQSERILRRNHEQFIIKQQKIKELEQRLQLNKDKAKGKKPIQTVTKQMIQNLQEEIGILEQERREGQRLWQQKIRAIDTEYEQKRLEEEKKLLILKEKEKEYKLNQLKIKELRKLVKHNLKTETTKPAEDIDMSQFRHKRNIKYLDK